MRSGWHAIWDAQMQSLPRRIMIADLAAIAGPFFPLAPKVGMTVREATAHMKSFVDAYNRASGGDPTP